MAEPHKDPVTLGTWIMSALGGAGGLGALLKMVWERRKAKDQLEHVIEKDKLDHSHELKMIDVNASLEERKDLAAELRRQVLAHEERIVRLEGQLAAILDERAQLLASNARLEAELAAALREASRLRVSRDYYRRIAQDGESLARRHGLIEAETLAEEISEADDARSKASS